MCVVSMVMDHYTDKWNQWNPPIMPYTAEPLRYWPIPIPIPEPKITDEEIREFRKLLERARKYDKDNGEPDCEMEEKKEKLRKLAAELGFDISFIDEENQSGN